MEVGIVDANLLIYAYNDGAFQHQVARRWLAHALSHGTLYLPWSSIQAFIRIITNERLFDPPLTPEGAATTVESWLAAPNTRIVEPGPRYWSVLRSILIRHSICGPDVSDAHLVALAIEHDLTLFTADSGFHRFAGLRYVNPLLA
ncbi:MAG TPA: TA system VapC family ribonuclease toxin [Thermoanaerobaculia bacterium]|nr:TA system VapC family ribonuclease toxin [Thermoanaerobaculia bacterium]